jgi:hypothetical protein
LGILVAIPIANPCPNHLHELLRVASFGDLVPIVFEVNTFRKDVQQCTQKAETRLFGWLRNAPPLTYADSPNLAFADSSILKSTPVDVEVASHLSSYTNCDKSIVSSNVRVRSHCVTQCCNEIFVQIYNPNMKWRSK